MDYVLWGVSWANLQLMMSDALRVDYKSDSEGGGTENGFPSVIDGNDPGSLDILLRMAGGKM